MNPMKTTLLLRTLKCKEEKVRQTDSKVFKCWLRAEVTHVDYIGIPNKELISASSFAVWRTGSLMESRGLLGFFWWVHLQNINQVFGLLLHSEMMSDWADQDQKRIQHPGLQFLPQLWNAERPIGPSGLTQSLVISFRRRTEVRNDVKILLSTPPHTHTPRGVTSTCTPAGLRGHLSASRPAAAAADTRLGLRRRHAPLARDAPPRPRRSAARSRRVPRDYKSRQPACGPSYWLARAGSDLRGEGWEVSGGGWEGRCGLMPGAAWGGLVVGCGAVPPGFGLCCFVMGSPRHSPLSAGGVGMRCRKRGPGPGPSGW